MAIWQGALEEVVVKKTLPNAVFWSSRSVVLIGHTGFQDSWKSLLSNQLGAEIRGFSVGVPTNPSCNVRAKTDGLLANYQRVNVTDSSFASEVFLTFRPQIVPHLAAPPHASIGHEDPWGIFSIVTRETVNILETSSQTKCVDYVTIGTTAKVYKNKERMRPHFVGGELGGADPDSASEAAAELVAAAYRGLAHRTGTKIVAYIGGRRPV